MDHSLLLAALKTRRPEVWQRIAIMDALDYAPWPEQARFHFDIDPKTGIDRRYKLVTGGEQAGKSLSAAMELMTRLFWGTLFWIVAPDYSQAENEFAYIESWCEKLGILSGIPNKPQKGAWSLRTITGQTVVTKSGKDVATISGKAPDGILFVEAAQAPYEAFLRCYGRTGPKARIGSWLCINGTFEKDTGGWFRNLWKAAQVENKWDLKSFAIPSWANLSNYPGGREDPQIVAFEGAFPDKDHFLERFGGAPASPKGLVHKEFDYTIHVKNMHRQDLLSQWEKEAQAGNPRVIFRDDEIYLPEDTIDELWIDPGYQFGYAVLFVSVWMGFAFVYDEIYTTGKNSEEVATMATKHPRFKHVGRLVMDISGHTHAGGNKSAAEAWQEVTKRAGNQMRPMSRLVQVADGIERLRISLSPSPDNGLPQIFFGAPTPKTCWELAEAYRYKTDRWGEPDIGDLPEDKNNHSVKAIVYGLTINFGPAKREHRNKARKVAKTGNSRTVGGWEMLYENQTRLGDDDRADQLPDGTEEEYGYDSSYEEED